MKSLFQRLNPSPDVASKRDSNVSSFNLSPPHNTTSPSKESQSPKAKMTYSQSTAIFSATYSSPTNETFTHTQTLIALQPTSSTKERTTYLGALRKGITEMQEKINKDLTARMEEDNLKSNSTAGAQKEGKAVVDEKKEEDNYGEEVVEED